MEYAMNEMEEKKNTPIKDAVELKASILADLEILKGLQKDGQPGYVMLMLTDRFLLEDLEVWEDLFSGDVAPDTAEEIFEKGLEIRIFHEDGEIRWFRSTIDKPWNRRECLNDKKKIALSEYNGLISLDAIEFLENPETDDRFYWDEQQYLDIDADKTKKLYADTGKMQNCGKVFATGGGSYQLPGLAYDKNPMVTIRNYLAHEPNGRCYVKDWRIVKFSTEKQEVADAVY